MVGGQHDMEFWKAYTKGLNDRLMELGYNMIPWGKADELLKLACLVLMACAVLHITSTLLHDIKNLVEMNKHTENFSGLHIR